MSSNQDNPYRILMRASSLGAELVGSILGAVLVGYLLDLWLGTGPVLLLVLGTVGIVGGGYNFVRDARRVSAAASRADAARRASRPASGRDAGVGSGGGGVAASMFEREAGEILPEDYAASDEELRRMIEEGPVDLGLRGQGGGGGGGGGGGDGENDDDEDDHERR